MTQVVPQTEINAAEALESAKEFDRKLRLAKNRHAFRTFGTIGFESYLSWVSPEGSKALRTQGKVDGFLKASVKAFGV